MANNTVREFVVSALAQYNDKLNTDILSSKESTSNKVTSIDNNSTDAQYPSAKAVNSKVSGLSGTAGIASVSNDIVTLKSGIQETSGVISNSSGTDISLHKIAKTGSPSDMTVQYNSETVSLQTALTNIKSGIDDATKAGQQYIVTNSTATCPNVDTYNSQQGTLAPSNLTTGKVYLVPNGTDSYMQYITTVSGSTYSWTPLGSTTVDLSGVVKIITVNGKQYAVSEGTTLIDLGDIVTEITGQAAISNADTSYIHTVITNTENTTNGTNIYNVETQTKIGNISTGTNGIAIVNDVKNYVDNKVIIRTWSN